VISLHDQQAGEVLWEADTRDSIMRDGRLFRYMQQMNISKYRWKNLKIALEI